MYNGLGRYIRTIFVTIITVLQDADGNYQTARYLMKDGNYWERTTILWGTTFDTCSDINNMLSVSLTGHYTYVTAITRVQKPIIN